jgi:hypothetical protein
MSKAMLKVDFGNYVNALIGEPPDDWAEKLAKAQKLCELAGVGSHLDDAEDVFLIAAVAHYQTHDVNLAGLIARVRQVVKWLSKRGPLPPLDADVQDVMSSLPVLENKSTELSRQLARGLTPREGFLLLIFNTGEGGYMVHTSTASRREQIGLLTEHLAMLKAEQDKKSGARSASTPSWLARHCARLVPRERRARRRDAHLLLRRVGRPATLRCRHRRLQAAGGRKQVAAASELRPRRLTTAQLRWRTQGANLSARGDLTRAPRSHDVECG